MKKHMFSKALAIIPLVCLMGIPTSTFAEGTAGFSNKSTSTPVKDYSNWMSKLKSEARLSELSIPGTHESVSFYGYPWELTQTSKQIAQTQTMPLKTQLQAGIRFLDIRLKPNGDSFDVYHGPIYQRKTFDEIMDTVSSYLKDHLNETILMRVRDENDGSSPNFEQIFKSYWNKYQAYFWKYNNNNNPTLGEVRGKVVILPDFKSTEKFGIPYGSLDIQDEYTKLNKEKAETAYNHLTKTVKDVSKSKIFLNYFSTNGVVNFNGFLHTFFSSPSLTPEGQAYGINSNMWLNLNDFERTGIIAMDFPSSGEVDTKNPANASHVPTLGKRGIIDVIIEKNNNVNNSGSIDNWFVVPLSPIAMIDELPTQESIHTNLDTPKTIDKGFGQLTFVKNGDKLKVTSNNNGYGISYNDQKWDIIVDEKLAYTFNEKTPVFDVAAAINQLNLQGTTIVIQENHI